MKTVKRRILFAILGGVLLLAGGVLDTYSQTNELRTLMGRIRWKKEMGVLPKSPKAKEAGDKCAAFFVVVTVPGSEKPYQYDIALEDKPEPSKPDYYSCRFEMKVPTNVALSVYAGMGDGLAWQPKSPSRQSRFHYLWPWIGGPTEIRGYRTFSPVKREVMLQNKDMQITFELVYEQ